MTVEVRHVTQPSAAEIADAKQEMTARKAGDTSYIVVKVAAENNNDYHTFMQVPPSTLSM